MNKSETALLLALASAYDQRTIGDADVLAWFALLESTSFTDAETVVKRHYATKHERVMPVDVLDGVKAIRADRLQRFESRVQPPAELSEPEYREWLRSTRLRIADGWVPPEPAAIDQARRAELDATIDPTFPSARTIPGEVA